mgnify:CR=1 FL=1
MSESETNPPTDAQGGAPGPHRRSDPAADVCAGGPVTVELTTELPAGVVEEIADLADDARQARDLAHDRVEYKIEFATPDGQRLEDVVAAE